jgi:hypothetical protein
MKITRQTLYIIGGSVAILGILGYLYLYGKTKKNAAAAAQAKLAELEAKGPVTITKYITVAPKTTTVKTPTTPAKVDPSGLATWTVGDTLYSRFDNVILYGNENLKFNDGDAVGEFMALKLQDGVQLAQIKNPNGKIYYSAVYFLSN